MLCLSVHQPVAGLIVVGWVRHHARAWTTGYRGLIGIHASETFSQEDCTLWEEPRLRAAFRGLIRIKDFLDAPRGAIIGTVLLTDTKPAENAFPPSPGAGAEAGTLPHQPTGIALKPGDVICNPLARLDRKDTLLVFSKPRMLISPIYCRAKPGLWAPDKQLEGRIYEQARQCYTDMELVTNRLLEAKQSTVHFTRTAQELE